MKNRNLLIFITLSVILVLTFMGCDGGNGSNGGLGGDGGFGGFSGGGTGKVWVDKSGGSSAQYDNLFMAMAMSGIALDSLSGKGGSYTIRIYEDQYPPYLDVPISKVSITLKAPGGPITINCDGGDDSALLFQLEGGASMTVDSGITVKGITWNAAFEVGGFHTGINTGAALVLNEGVVITGFQNAIIVNFEDSLVTLNGAIIKDFTEIGVSLDEGAKLIMNKGEIAGKAEINAHFWGVILDDNAEFTMNGGTISGSNTGTKTQGVIVNSSSTFKMNGGKITGNRNELGAGVTNSGTFIMTGGEISGNAAEREGGGVYSSFRNASFTMTGGTITGNTAKWGGGVYNSMLTNKEYEGSVFKKTGGTITGGDDDNGNHASEAGHAAMSDYYLSQTGDPSSNVRDATAGPGDHMDCFENYPGGGWDGAID